MDTIGKPKGQRSTQLLLGYAKKIKTKEERKEKKKEEEKRADLRKVKKKNPRTKKDWTH